jgi:hypothetical protein
MLNIFAQAPATVEPGNRALDNPPVRLNLKADVVSCQSSCYPPELIAYFASVEVCTEIYTGIAGVWL